MRLCLAGTVMAAMAVPGMAAALGQTIGVSHPEQVPMTSSEAMEPPVVRYVVPAATKPSPTLKERRPETRPTSAIQSYVSPGAGSRGNVDPVDGMIVGDDVRGLVHPETDENVLTRVAGSSNQLPIGTMMKVRIASALTTQRTQEGSEFTAELTEPVLRDGRVLVPAGSLLSGRVTDVHGGRRITGAASIHLQPMAITLPDGIRYKMHAQVIDTSLYKQTRVDNEGTILRRDHKAATGAALGLATGSGAAAGGLIGGLPGALIGGAIGAGIGTAVWLKQDRQEELPAGTRLVFSLTAPLAFGTAKGFEN